MPRGVSGAIGLFAGAMIAVLFFGSTLKHIGPFLLAAALLIGIASTEFLVERCKRNRNK
jgi:hypothetical protein